MCMLCLSKDSRQMSVHFNTMALMAGLVNMLALREGWVPANEAGTMPKNRDDAILPTGLRVQDRVDGVNTDTYLFEAPNLYQMLSPEGRLATLEREFLTQMDESKAKVSALLGLEKMSLDVSLSLTLVTNILYVAITFDHTNAKKEGT